MGDKPSIESMRAALANLTEPKKWGDDQEGSRNLLAWAITRLESLRAENEALKAISCCVPCGDQFDTEHQRGTCGVCLNAERARADEAEKALALIGERAVVDWDDRTVGAVDAVVKDPQRYGDWLRETLAKAHRADALAARVETLEYVLRYCTPYAMHHDENCNWTATPGPCKCGHGQIHAVLHSTPAADLEAHDAKVREPLEKRIEELEDRRAALNEREALTADLRDLAAHDARVRREALEEACRRAMAFTRGATGYTDLVNAILGPEAQPNEQEGK